MDGDTLVREYLGRLEAAAWPLAADRRVELLAEVREHIEAAVSAAGRSDEVTVRNILERLGLPQEIVASEGEPPAVSGSWAAGQQGGGVVASSSLGAIEIIALLLLTVGAVFVPFVGPILGLVFVWVSTRWTQREKLIATAIVAILLLAPLFAVLGAGTSIG
jgi:uncharacterized membrane protein